MAVTHNAPRTSTSLWEILLVKPCMFQKPWNAEIPYSMLPLSTVRSLLPLICKISVNAPVRLSGQIMMTRLQTVPQNNFHILLSGPDEWWIPDVSFFPGPAFVTVLYLQPILAYRKGTRSWHQYRSLFRLCSGKVKKWTSKSLWPHQSYLVEYTQLSSSPGLPLLSFVYCLRLLLFLLKEVVHSLNGLWLNFAYKTVHWASGQKLTVPSSPISPAFTSGRTSNSLAFSSSFSNRYRRVSDTNSWSSRYGARD